MSPSTPAARAAARARRYAASVDEVVDIPPLLPPAPNPCASCPYRRDVPSGVWSAKDYAKLPGYDRPTGEQPIGVFRCHQHDPDDVRARVCGGWAHVHARNPRGHELLALRLAVPAGLLSATQVRAVAAFTTAVACFGSGAQAAAHGLADLHAPGPEAVAMSAKIIRRRPSTAAPQRVSVPE